MRQVLIALFLIVAFVFYYLLFFCLVQYGIVGIVQVIVGKDSVVGALSESAGQIVAVIGGILVAGWLASKTKKKVFKSHTHKTDSTETR